MKKILLLGALALVNMAGLFAIDLDVQVRGGYFYPMSGVPKRIYHGGGIYGAEVSTGLMDNLHVWGSVNYFARRGKTHGLSGEDYGTRLTYLPFAAGFKLVAPLEDWLDVYAGLGGQYARFHTHDRSPFAIHHVKKWGWGGILKLGAIVHVTDCIFLDLFSDYSLLRVNFNHRSHFVERKRTTLDGWIFGVGLGLQL